jgi:choline dehydrogenase-like flavoprotein
VYGCPFGAKSSVDLTAIRRGERTGRLKVLTKARAVGIETAPDGRVATVVYRTGRTIERARARAVVLALGAVETPRLLLTHRSSTHPDGLANASGVVGRYLMETVYAMINARFDERLDAHKGPPIDARIWNFSRPSPGGRARSGYVLGVSGTSGGFHGPVSYALRTPGIGRAHKQAMRARFGTVLSLFGIAEQEPRAANRITLADEPDADGVPRVRIESAHSETDHLAVEEMLARVKSLAMASGSVELLHQITSYDEPMAQHVGGTCRMGRDPATSVVDPHGRAHDVPNLFIADASVLPGQGAGDSPSLTIQALAIRTAEHIVSLARRHEL